MSGENMITSKASTNMEGIGPQTLTERRHEHVFARSSTHFSSAGAGAGIGGGFGGGPSLAYLSICYSLMCLFIYALMYLCIYGVIHLFVCLFITLFI